MNSLGMRSARYFLVRAVKYLGVVIGVGLFLVAEMFVLNIGEPDQMEVALNWLISGPIFMALIMNVAYSLYSVSWTDSVVLSMGARRKDIFIGDIIQTIVLLGGAWLFVTIAAIITNQSTMIGFNSIILFKLSFKSSILCFGNPNIKSIFILSNPTSFAKLYVFKNSSYVCILPNNFKILS